MSYEAGYRRNFVTIRNKVVAESFGETTQYKDICTVRANKEWKHGGKAMREGALDVYDKVVFRMNYNNIVSRESLLVCDGKTYQVLSLNGDFTDNEIEILAQEITDPKKYAPSSSSISGGERQESEFGG